MLAPDSSRITARSLLPYDLAFVTRQSRRDIDALVLEATMTGDLEGFSRWTLRAEGVRTTAVFDEEVITRKSLLRRLPPMARPAFRANHALMMRHGQAGLRTYGVLKTPPRRKPRSKPERLPGGWQDDQAVTEEDGL